PGLLQKLAVSDRDPDLQCFASFGADEPLERTHRSLCFADSRRDALDRVSDRTEHVLQSLLHSLWQNADGACGCAANRHDVVQGELVRLRNLYSGLCNLVDSNRDGSARDGVFDTLF